MRNFPVGMRAWTICPVSKGAIISKEREASNHRTFLFSQNGWNGKQAHFSFVSLPSQLRSLKASVPGAPLKFEEVYFSTCEREPSSLVIGPGLVSSCTPFGAAVAHGQAGLFVGWHTQRTASTRLKPSLQLRKRVPLHTHFWSFFAVLASKRGERSTQQGWWCKWWRSTVRMRTLVLQSNQLLQVRV